MRASTITIVAAAALSTAAIAQVGTEPTDNKVPANQAVGNTSPPTDAAPATDDAPASDRADAPANVTPTPGDPDNASGPPPKAPR